MDINVTSLDILSWFRANKPLLFLLIVVCLMLILLDLALPRGLSRTHHTQDKHDNHSEQYNEHYNRFIT